MFVASEMLLKSRRGCIELVSFGILSWVRTVAVGNVVVSIVGIVPVCYVGLYVRQRSGIDKSC